jgi:hypothetical protein
MTRSTRKLMAVPVALWASLLGWARPLWPGTITVTGGCELSEAIAAANSNVPVGGCAAGSGADDIHLTDDILLQDELNAVASEIVIYGHGHGIGRSVTAEEFSVFRVQAGGELTLRDLEISWGRASHGGAIHNLQGDLTLVNTRLVFNQAESSGGGIFNDQGHVALYASEVVWNVANGDADSTAGGGISNNYGELEIVDSTISFNSATGTHANGGGVKSVGDLFVSGSTISQNTVSGDLVSGAGMSAEPWEDSAIVIVNSTFSGNQAIDETAPHSSAGGGLFAGGDAAAAQVANTTFHGNQADSGAAIHGSFALGVALSRSLLAGGAGTLCDGTVTNGGDNLADAASCGSVPATLSGLDPALADHGGPTETHALLAGSSAIDRAGACGLESDQRGAPRFDEACDSGSFEFGGCPRLDLADAILMSTAVYEECEIRVGPNYVVAGPSGDLTVTSGTSVTLFDGFAVEAEGEAIISIDPDLQVLSALEAAADAGWRGTPPGAE